tara:strand:+ start:7348 stop:7647 length:300 start_codon:yes stop_codon:yes gene_type:complete
MVTKDKKEYLRNRFSNLPEEKKEEHRMRRLADYHSMSEYARQKEVKRRQQYYIENKEKLKERQKEYYAENRDVYVEYARNKRKKEKELKKSLISLEVTK